MNFWRLPRMLLHSLSRHLLSPKDDLEHIKFSSAMSDAWISSRFLGGATEFSMIAAEMPMCLLVYKWAGSRNNDNKKIKRERGCLPHSSFHKCIWNEKIVWKLMCGVVECCFVWKATLGKLSHVPPVVEHRSMQPEWGPGKQKHSGSLSSPPVPQTRKVAKTVSQLILWQVHSPTILPWKLQPVLMLFKNRKHSYYHSVTNFWYSFTVDSVLK